RPSAEWKDGLSLAGGAAHGLAQLNHGDGPDDRKRTGSVNGAGVGRGRHSSHSVMFEPSSLIPFNLASHGDLGTRSSHSAGFDPSQAVEVGKNRKLCPVSSAVFAFTG